MWIERLRAFVVGVVILCLVGCSSVRVIDQPAPATVQQKVAVGKQVKVLTKTQHRYELKGTAIDSDGFTGRDAADKAWRVPYDQIQQIEVREFNGWKTSGLTVGVIVVTLGVLAYLGARAFAHGLDHIGD